MTRSKPAALHAAITSGERRRHLAAAVARGQRAEVDVRRRRSRSSGCGRRAARRRSCAASGRSAITAMRSLSSWSSRKRRTSSSVSDDLPEPPVPVMPSTGACRAGAPARAAASRRCSSATAVLQRGDRCARARARSPRCEPGQIASAGRRVTSRSTSQRATMSLIMPGRPSRWPSSGREDARDAVALQLARSPSATITPPPPPKTLMCPAAALAQQVDQVLEVLDVAALVGADGDALHVLLQRRVDDLVDRAVVAEVDHLARRMPAGSAA